MMKKVKTLVVDDHPLFAQATKQILQEIESIDCIGVVGNGAECLRFIRNERPDLIFLDYHLPDEPGSVLAQKIKDALPAVKIVIFTGIDIADMFNHLIKIGVSGIISKESSEATIRNMVNCILDNHTVLPLSVFHQTRLVLENSVAELELTEDEITIMRMIVGGHTHDQIAVSIHVSKRSVDNYLKRIYDKLGVKSKVQAIEKFVQSKYYAEAVQGG
jgi:DNA-binding NarL/FixJ family response regulator